MMLEFYKTFSHSQHNPFTHSIVSILYLNLFTNGRKDMWKSTFQNLCSRKRIYFNDEYLFQKVNNMHVTNLKITVFVLKNITPIPTRMAMSKKCTSNLNKGEKKEKVIIKIYVYLNYKLRFPSKSSYRKSVWLLK